MTNYAVNQSAITIDQFNTLIDFLKASTINFDESHDWMHGLAVYQKTIEIAESEQQFYEYDILTYASLLHDVRDHKYKNTISELQLMEFLLEQIGMERAISVVNIINCVSYSKEIAKNCDYSGVNMTYLTYIRDADRLEAIGQLGLQRCIKFTESKNGNIPLDVVKHCKEKLLKLYSENYIVTNTARHMAIPLHNCIQNYVHKYDIEYPAR